MWFLQQRSEFETIKVINKKLKKQIELNISNVSGEKIQLIYF